jgi:crotonobetainyl-CoA:carnitine CoA-transferase CaiB-like acyl-CoA transferase
MKPLQGVKVVDLTTYLAAPTTVRVLGEWGADCVKIESPKGDPARTQGAVFNMPYDDDENLAFDVANLNKKFITLNLKTETGLEIAYKLLSEADVFVTSTRTKSLKKLGLDYETLKEKFPSLIFAQVLGYGEHGPEKDNVGFDVTCYMARGGVFGTTVNRGDSPMIPTNGYGDFQVSLCLAAGICAALFNRMRTGLGDKITVSLQHTAVFMLSTGIISAQYGNPYPKNRREVINPFNNVYRTSDQKWVVICCPEYDRDFDKIMSLIGRKDLVGSPIYSNCAEVNARGEISKVVDILDEGFSKLTRDEVIRIFRENDLACEAAYEPLDIYKDEQVWANNILTKLPYPSGERMIATNPIQFSSLGMPEYKNYGSQGAQTVEIMHHLGYTDVQIQQAINCGAAEDEKKLKKL